MHNFLCICWQHPYNKIAVVNLHPLIVILIWASIKTQIELELALRLLKIALRMCTVLSQSSFSSHSVWLVIVEYEEMSRRQLATKLAKLETKLESQQQLQGHQGHDTTSITSSSDVTASRLRPDTSGNYYLSISPFCVWWNVYIRENLHHLCSGRSQTLVIIFEWNITDISGPSGIVVLFAILFVLHVYK